MKFKLIFYILLTTSIFGQVNTEKFRNNNMQLGASHKLGMNIQLIEGNSSLSTIQGNYRLDYRKNKYHSFLVLNLKNGHENGQNFVNKGFSHLRIIKELDTHYAEVFLQNEFNDFIDLKRRSLLGSGIRLNISSNNSRNTYIGIGAMYEQQDQLNKQSSVIRSTNYITNESHLQYLTLSTTAYWQPLFSDFSAFRALFIQNFKFKITDKLNVVIAFNFRYDNQLENRVKSWDYELSNGLEFSF